MSSEKKETLAIPNETSDIPELKRKRLTTILGYDSSDYDERKHVQIKKSLRRSTTADFNNIPTEYLLTEFYGFKEDDPNLLNKKGYYDALQVLKSKEPKQRTMDDIKLMRKYFSKI